MLACIRTVHTYINSTYVVRTYIHTYIHTHVHKYERMYVRTQPRLCIPQVQNSVKAAVGC